MNLFDYFKDKKFFIDDSNRYRSLRIRMHNLYENNKLEFLQLQRDNIEENRQKRLLIEINLLATFLGKEKINEKEPTFSTLRAYPDSLL